MSIFCFQKDPPSGLLLFGFQANQDLLFLIGGTDGGRGGEIDGPFDTPRLPFFACSGDERGEAPLPFSLFFGRVACRGFHQSFSRNLVHNF